MALAHVVGCVQILGFDQDYKSISECDDSDGVCQPPGSCDSTGYCDGCIDCAVAGNCADEMSSCEEHGDCQEFEACTFECVDQACLDACEAQYPAGASRYQDLMYCVFGIECSNDCNGAYTVSD
jgi:hypothetical protein